MVLIHESFPRTLINSFKNQLRYIVCIINTRYLPYFEVAVRIPGTGPIFCMRFLTYRSTSFFNTVQKKNDYFFYTISCKRKLKIAYD
jgi:hypothetical protein